MGNDSGKVLIARPGQALHDHLANVSSLSSFFAGVLNLPTAGELIGGLHDAGKASSAFQKYIRSATGLCDSEAEDYVDAAGLRIRIDHSTAGAQLLWHGISQSQPKAQDMLSAQMLALCICSHHSGLIDCLGPNGDRTFNQRMNKPEEAVHLQEATEALGSDGVARSQELLSAAVQEMRQRLATMIRPEPSSQCVGCRLRGQNACRIPNPLAWFSLGLTTRMLFSCLIDADRTDTADSERPANVQLRSSGRPDWPKLISLLEARISKLSDVSRIDGIRREVSECCRNRAQDSKGVFTLTVPTGGGKTLSGLRFALHHAARHSMDRIINVIPYTSIIDQSARAPCCCGLRATTETKQIRRPWKGRPKSCQESSQR